MKNTDKAYSRLKEFIKTSNSFEDFQNIFNENLDIDKKDIAIKLLLQVCYMSFKSDGERFNDLLSLVDKKTEKKLIVWLNGQMSKLSKDNIIINTIFDLKEKYPNFKYCKDNNINNKYLFINNDSIFKIDLTCSIEELILDTPFLRKVDKFFQDGKIKKGN